MAYNQGRVGLDWHVPVQRLVYPVNRIQRVVLNGYSSSWSSVLSGVPQGSVPGPLLFNIYVNEMPNCVNSPILQFADDVKMFQAIGGPADFQQLQADINSFVDWSIKINGQ